MPAHATTPSRPKAGTGAATAQRWGDRAPPGQSTVADFHWRGRRPKAHTPTVFFSRVTTRLATASPFPFFPFFTPQHHGIAADRQFLPTLPGCLPISPARLLILSELLHLFFRVPSSHAYTVRDCLCCPLSAPHRQIVAQLRPPVVRSGIVLFSHPVISVLSDFYKRRIRFLSTYIYPAVGSTPLTPCDTALPLHLPAPCSITRQNICTLPHNSVLLQSYFEIL